MNKDINWDLVTEYTTWEEDKIWTKDMKPVTKDNMELECEYVIF